MNHKSPYAHRSCIASPCEVCRGTGRVTVTRGTWTGEVRCETCDGYGECYVSEFCGIAAGDPPAAPTPVGERGTPMQVAVSAGDDGTITVGGYRVSAPAFRDAGQFEAAIERAFAAGLLVSPADSPDRFHVRNPDSGSVYSTTRTSCTCLAGQHDTPCKHMAMVCFLLDIAHGSEVA